MIVSLSIDSAKMKRMITSLTPFLAKKICQGKAIYVYECMPSHGNTVLMALTSTMKIL